MCRFSKVIGDKRTAGAASNMFKTKSHHDDVLSYMTENL